MWSRRVTLDCNGRHILSKLVGKVLESGAGNHMNTLPKVIGRFVFPSVFSLALAASTSAIAASPASPAASAAAVSRVHISNFGKVGDEYYRGAQPDGRDYDDLAALGVKTVIDLTKDGRDNEKGMVEHAGMSFVRIPMTTGERPSDAAVKQFLSIVNDPAKQPVYVHCQGGQHRTGVMTAVYRMTKYGWTEDKAYDEMKQYKFETFFGHPELRQFVHDFFTKLPPATAPIVATAAAAVPVAEGQQAQAQASN
jgi:tyrosine-protein phosphatase SIW14